jgi:hypothetical protein
MDKENTAMTLAPTLIFEDTPRTRRTDPETSHAAADSNNVNASQVAVLRVLAVCHEGLADHEISDLIELSPVVFSEGVRYTESRVRTARNEVAQHAYVALVPDMHRLTRSGGKTRVWKITDAGLEYLRAVSE